MTTSRFEVAITDARSSRMGKFHVPCFWLVLAAVPWLAGCSPEDGRARGGGPGADVGNRPTVVRPPSKIDGTRGNP